MRCTMGTIAATTAGILLALAFWPQDRAVEGPQVANAQSQKDAKPNQFAQNKEAMAPQSDRVDSVVEKKLTTTLEDINFVEVPLKEVLEQIGGQIEVDILVDETSLEEYGLTLDTPVTLQLEYAELPAKTALDLILRDRVGDLGFRVRDGFIWISTIDEIHQILDVRIYNVRDLLAAAEAHRAAGKGWSVEDGQPPVGGMGGGLGGMGGGFGGGGGGGFFSMPSRSAAAMLTETAAGQEYGGGMGGMGGGGMTMGEPPQQQQRPEVSPVYQLIDVIQESTSGPWEEHSGTGGTITPFDGLLVIRQTQQVHQEIERLLEMLREAAQKDRGRQMVRDRKGNDLIVRVYSVGRLIRPKGMTLDGLADLIRRNVEPGSWEHKNGPGRLAQRPKTGGLVIWQTQKVHKQITDLLQRLRDPDSDDRE